MDDRVKGEEAIIARFLAPLAAGHPASRGLGDDCAVWTPTAGMELVMKTDPIAEGVHFFADDPPAAIGWKALAVNVSDLAAKGATPRVYLMALSFPEAPRGAWLTAFTQGLGEAQAAFGIDLVGGDTDRRAGPVTISVTVIGEAPAGMVPGRSGGRAGDQLYVSGTIGDGLIGLSLRTSAAAFPGAGLDASTIENAIERYWRPRPRLGLRGAILKHARASMDVSDGLIKDLGRLVRASGCGAVIDADRVPISATASRVVASGGLTLADLFTGGDDYEVLAAVSPGECAAFEAAAAAGGVPVAAIGELVAGAQVRVFSSGGAELSFASGGWDHFDGSRD